MNVPDAVSDDDLIGPEGKCPFLAQSQVNKWEGFGQCHLSGLAVLSHPDNVDRPKVHSVLYDYDVDCPILELKKVTSSQADHSNKEPKRKPFNSQQIIAHNDVFAVPTKHQKDVNYRDQLAPNQLWIGEEVLAPEALEKAVLLNGSEDAEISHTDWSNLPNPTRRQIRTLQFLMALFLSKL